MTSRPTPQADAERAVMAFKHAEAVKVMRHIVNLALARGRVFPGDLSADLVAKDDRQGVLSNSWASLRALEIIRPISPRVFDDAAGIVAGKKQNPHEDAKGRWVMVYELANRALALTWLRRNGGVDCASVDVTTDSGNFNRAAGCNLQTLLWSSQPLGVAVQVSTGGNR